MRPAFKSTCPVSCLSSTWGFPPCACCASGVHACTLLKLFCCARLQHADSPPSHIAGLGFCQDLNLLSVEPADVVATCNTIYGLLLQVRLLPWHVVVRCRELAVCGCACSCVVVPCAAAGSSTLLHLVSCNTPLLRLPARLWVQHQKDCKFREQLKQGARSCCTNVYGTPAAASNCLWGLECTKSLCPPIMN